MILIEHTTLKFYFFKKESLPCLWTVLKKLLSPLKLIIHLIWYIENNIGILINLLYYQHISAITTYSYSKVQTEQINFLVFKKYLKRIFPEENRFVCLKDLT